MSGLFACHEVCVCVFGFASACLLNDDGCEFSLDALGFLSFCANVFVTPQQFEFISCLLFYGNILYIREAEYLQR